MTNNEKIQKIMEYLCKQISRLDGYRNEAGGLSSAEWLFIKTKRETLLDVLKNVELIANRN